MHTAGESRLMEELTQLSNTEHCIWCRTPSVPVIKKYPLCKRCSRRRSALQKAHEQYLQLMDGPTVPRQRRYDIEYELAKAGSQVIALKKLGNRFGNIILRPAGALNLDLEYLFKEFSAGSGASDGGFPHANDFVYFPEPLKRHLYYLLSRIIRKRKRAPAGIRALDIEIDTLLERLPALYQDLE